MTEKSLEFTREIYFDNRKSRLYVPDEGYYVPNEGYYVPDEGYSRNTSW
jgi:hypothetical protein